MRITPLVWVSFGLVSLTVSVMLAGDSLIDLSPGRDRQIFEYRRDLSESLAVQYSALAERDQLDVLKFAMETLAQRNTDILSLALLQNNGMVVARIGEHARIWVQPPGEESTLDFFQVPIFSGDQPWGVLQIAFRQVEAHGLRWFLSHPWVQFLGFVSGMGFVGYLLFMRRTLKQLDPTAVVPTRVKAALDALAQGLVMIDTRDTIVLVNEAFSSRVERPISSLVGSDLGDLPWETPDQPGRTGVRSWTQAIMDKTPITGASVTLTTSDGGDRKFTVNSVPIMDDQGTVRGALVSFDDVTELEKANASLIQAVTELEQSREKILNQNQMLDGTNRSLQMEIAERKRAEAEREEMNKQLVVASRRAGMADVASTVLHNVGNVLNSVNVSASTVIKLLGQSPVGDLGIIATMLREQGQDVGRFLTQDERGKQIPAYLGVLAESMKGNDGAVKKELESLCQNIDHIKHIVMSQQDLAKPTLVEEACVLTELMDQAFRINQTSLDKSGAQVVREYADLPAIVTDRHQVLQILVNLISNANAAMAARPTPDHCLTLSVGRADDRNGFVRLAVRDTGIGITPENLSNIFRQGFTTKKDGHGLGLHGAILSAKAMGGTLTVQSDGEGKGAVFALELPEKLIAVAV
jgi:PAS domain S-box-containing protein